MMTNSDDRGDRDPAPAATRAVRILEYLGAVDRPATLTDIARSIGAAKSSTSNLCSVLEGASLVSRVDGGYLLGHRVLELGGSYLRQFDEMRLFYRFCDASSVLVDEIVQIAMLDGTDVIYLARHEGRSPMRLTANVGDRYPAALTAVGNALLAGEDRQAVRNRFSSPASFPRRTDRSVQSVAALERALDLVDERGYALDEGGTHPGVVGIALRVPPRTTHSPALAVGVSVIAPAVSDRRERELAAELRRLGTLLGNPLTTPPVSAV